METKNLKTIEWRENTWDNVVRIRITTKEAVVRPRIFKIFNMRLNGFTYGMEVYNDWCECESDCCYKSLIDVFLRIAEICDCELAELTDTMVEINKLLENMD